MPCVRQDFDDSLGVIPLLDVGIRVFKDTAEDNLPLVEENLGPKRAEQYGEDAAAKVDPFHALKVELGECRQCPGDGGVDVEIGFYHGENTELSRSEEFGHERVDG